MKLLTTVLLAFSLLLLNACQTLQPDFEKPDIQVTSIEALPSQGFEQRFKIGLRLTNPNDKALNIRGISYDMDIEGHKVLSGVANSIPEISAYADTSFTTEASISLLSSFKLINELLNNPKNIVKYAMNAKLDTGIPLIGKISLVDAGEIPLLGEAETE